jgi:hypothetical protein
LVSALASVSEKALASVSEKALASDLASVLGLGLG